MKKYLILGLIFALVYWLYKQFKTTPAANTTTTSTATGNGSGNATGSGNGYVIPMGNDTAIPEPPRKPPIRYDEKKPIEKPDPVLVQASPVLSSVRDMADRAPFSQNSFSRI